jgi:hypothetical protein
MDKGTVRGVAELSGADYVRKSIEAQRAAMQAGNPLERGRLERLAATYLEAAEAAFTIEAAERRSLQPGRTAA